MTEAQQQYNKEFLQLVEEKFKKNQVPFNIASFLTLVGMNKNNDARDLQIQGTFSIKELKLIIESMQEMKEKVFLNDK